MGFNLRLNLINGITCIPRVLRNPKKEENPLYQYLLKQGVGKQLLEVSYVKMHVTWVTTDYRGDKIYHWREEYYNFIDVPMYEHACDVEHAESTSDYPSFSGAFRV